MISSAIRDRCTALSAAAARKSTTKSRSETASRLFSLMRLKPKLARDRMRDRSAASCPPARPLPAASPPCAPAPGRNARDRARASRHRRQMMGERDRLRALEMRVAGHHGLEMAMGERDQRAAQSVDERDHLGQFVAQIEPQVERDLVVARARGMQFAPAARRSVRSGGARSRDGCPRRQRSKRKRPAADLALDRAQTGDDFARPRRAATGRSCASIRACAIEPRISWR